MDVQKVNQYLNDINASVDKIRAEVNTTPVKVIRTDRDPAPKPTLPTIGPAGSSFVDPLFNTKITRITDEKSHPDGYAVSFRTPGASPQVAWSSNSLCFYVESTWGEIFLYSWDGTKATRIAKVPLIEPAFAQNSSTQIIGNMQTADHVSIGSYDITTSKVTLIRDLRTIPGVGDLTNTYVSGVYVGGDYFATCFGGPSQDLMKYAIKHLINGTTNFMIDTTQKIGATLHATAIDKSGRFMILYPNGAGSIGSLGVRIYPAYVWDTQANTIVPITNVNGHQVCGNGVAIDQQCLGAWDAAQWLIRQLTDSMGTARELINPILTPKETYLADHQNWNNFSTPISTSGTFRYKVSNSPDVPWRAWDDEIIGVDNSKYVVYRYCHHRSNVYRENGADGLEFWTTPRPNISPNGKWILFTSNMERTLGTDVVEKIARQDVFLADLT